MYLWGDDAEHFHVWFVPQPLDYLDLRGFYLMDWFTTMPPASEEELRVAAVDLRARLSGQ